MRKNTYLDYFAICVICCLLYCTSSCAGRCNGTTEHTVNTTVQTITLPQPYETRSTMNFSKVVGWQNGTMPRAPNGFKVSKFADSLRSCRWIYVLPNGDVLVSQSNTEVKGVKKVGADLIGASRSEHVIESPNKITLLRDVNKNGIPDIRTDFLTGLNKPFGIILIDNFLYVAVTDGIWRYPYTAWETKITTRGTRIIDLPAGDHNRHWTRNIIANESGTKIYISVGSSSNIAENGIEAELRRACILEINPDGTGERIYAAGLRNPVGMGWAPGSKTLWTAVNERDNLGDDLVPDYATCVKDGGFYGWPYAYFGPNPDPRIEDHKRPDLVKATIVPDVALGSHTASLGLAFYTGKSFPKKYIDGMFIGQHGSWNCKKLSGYKVVFIPFKNGQPSGPPEDFLTGFISNMSKSEVHGRPVGVTVMPDGSLLVADDASDTIWRISYADQISYTD